VIVNLQFRAQQGATSPTQIERTALAAAPALTRVRRVKRAALIASWGPMLQVDMRVTAFRVWPGRRTVTATQPRLAKNVDQGPILTPPIKLLNAFRATREGRLSSASLPPRRRRRHVPRVRRVGLTGMGAEPRSASFAERANTQRRVLRVARIARVGKLTRIPIPKRHARTAFQVFTLPIRVGWGLVWFARQTRVLRSKRSFAICVGLITALYLAPPPLVMARVYASFVQTRSQTLLRMREGVIRWMLAASGAVLRAGSASVAPRAQHIRTHRTTARAPACSCAAWMSIRRRRRRQQVTVCALP